MSSVAHRALWGYGPSKHQHDFGCGMLDYRERKRWKAEKERRTKENEYYGHVKDETVELIDEMVELLGEHGPQSLRWIVKTTGASGEAVKSAIRVATYRSLIYEGERLYGVLKKDSL